MIILKPCWIDHEDKKPIFSVDVHPKGRRFVTGGQGGSGGRIVIWNLEPLLSEDASNDPSVPKMLCQMDNHLACVNVVRWSNEGHLLASGGDDKLVMIWKLTGEGSSAIFGGGGKINMETWKCVHTLNSHSGDVLDIAWAPHDGWLASGSVDNTVIIWNTQKFPEKVVVLKGHTGMVKGVVFDPVGKYIASQSDDKTLRVWRTADWAQQEMISDPFVECSATTHVLRLSWSPDGQYLVSAHAMNGGGPTAQIIERDGWKHDKDYVGHRKAVTCVRFNSNVLKKTKLGNQSSTQQYCCCAMGSRDRSISVWLTSLKRPLVVIKELFDDSVLDLSWSSNGLCLLACSWDGTVACIIFSVQEIGTPLSTSEKNLLYERMYGKSLEKNWNQSFISSQIVENPELLQDIQEQSKEQIKPEPEKISVTEETSVKPQVSDLNKPATPTVFVPANKQIETRLPSGKRRITPMFLKPAPASDTLEVPKEKMAANAFSSSSPTKSKIVVETVSESKMKSLTTKSTQEVKQQTSKEAMNHIPTYVTPGVQINQLMCSDVPGDQPIVHFINILDPLKMPPGTTVTKRAAKAKLQITNNCRTTSKGSIAKIEVFKAADDTQPMWQTYLGSTIRCVATNRKVIVSCCDDLSINSYDLRTGARVLPVLVIEDAASALCLTESGYCLVLTKTGLLHMWDMEKRASVLNRVSLRCLLSKKATVTSCIVSSSNMPVVTLSDGRAYAYNTDLQTWIILSNPTDPLSKAGGSMARAVATTQPLASLQRSMPLTGSSDNLPSGVTLSFLEGQIVASSALQSATEFRHWILTTVNHLLEKGPECRLRSILDELMEPAHARSVKPKNEMLFGIPRRILLNEILAIIKSKLPWQRLYQEYSEQLSA